MSANLVPCHSQPVSYRNDTTLRIAVYINTDMGNNAFVGVPGVQYVDLQMVPTPLVAQLSGPSGDARRGKTIALSAVSSTDPDDPTNTLEPLSFWWECSPCRRRRLLRDRRR